MNTAIPSKESRIKTVAIYLRKSRGDDENALSKHREELTELCKKRGWRYVIYSEIGSGDAIITRPEMMKLLKDIEDELYDAVVVYDYDRLGRGDLSDQDRIIKTFKNSNTLIVTPYRIYDLWDENDEQYTDFQGFLARQEYKMIKKRLRRGKIIGSKMGNWTNGRPPFPYEYDPDRKGLVVNKEKLPIYRFMVESYLAGDSLHDIAWKLNKQGIPSPRNGRWHDQVIRRILIDETHLGKIIANKTEGDICRRRPSSKPFRTIPRSEWIVVEGCHEAVKTENEHNKILAIMHKRAIRRSKSATYPLSGLIKCGICGATMSFYKTKGSKRLRIKPCQGWVNEDKTVKCDNRGGDPQLIVDAIMDQLEPFVEFIKSKLQEELDNNDIITNEIEHKEEQIRKKEKALDRIRIAYEEEAYTLSEFRERSEKVKKEISELEGEIMQLKNKLGSQEGITNEERIRIINEFKLEMKNPKKSPEDLNRMFKKIVDHIVWKRTEEGIVEITVNFL